MNTKSENKTEEMKSKNSSTEMQGPKSGKTSTNTRNLDELFKGYSYSSKNKVSNKEASKDSKSLEKNETNYHPNNDSALKEFFIDGLKDLYWAEKHLVPALKKMNKAATSEQLKETLNSHLEETQGQVTRLEDVFASIEEKASAKKCEAMEGILKEADSMVEETEDGTFVRDVAIIAACQKVEHYEIGSYGTLVAIAKILSYNEAANLLEETLEQEKNADQSLTDTAYSFIYEEAIAE